MMEKCFAQSGDCEMAFLESGSGTEAVLFLHGFPTSAQLWREILPLIGETRRAVAPDLLGFGDTREPPSSDYSIAGQAERVMGLMDSLGIEQFTAVGHGQGGGVAQVLAVTAPERVERLVLIDSAAFDNWPTPEDHALLFFIDLPLLPEVARRAGWLDTLARSRFGLPRQVLDASALARDAVGEYLRPVVASPEGLARFQRYMTAMDCKHTVHAAVSLADYDRPTAIIWAGDDRRYSVSWAKRLYDTIPGAQRFEIIAGCGHLVPEEKPAELADNLLDFLDDTAELRG
jgi:pimeloyl-ACP methyl ester carboxylesterase